MNADLSASPVSKPPKSMAELFRLADAARERADANTLSDTDPYDASLGVAAATASAAVFNRAPETLADLLLLSGWAHLALGYVDDTDVLGCMLLRENLKACTGNIVRFLASHPALDPPTDLTDWLERTAAVELPPGRWLCPKLLPVGASTTFLDHGGVGKSLATLQISALVAEAQEALDEADAGPRFGEGPGE